MIPAAGQGKRFQHLELGIPKELLRLGRLTLLEHAFREAAAAGFEAAVIVVSPAKAAALRQNLAGAATALPLEFREQALPLGLGDAVRLGGEATRSDSFAVLLPDDVIPGAAHWRRLLAAHRTTGAAALCVRKVPESEVSRFGIALVEPERQWLRVRGVVEKPDSGTVASSLAVLGRYIVTAPVCEALASLGPGAGGEIQLADAFAECADTAPGVVAVEFEGVLFDCGTPEEYERSKNRYRYAG